MNTIISNWLNKAIILLGLFALVSCASDELIAPDSQNTEEKPMQSIPMRFQVRMQQFDSAGQDTRGTSWEWTNGAVVYLQFHNGTSVVRGYADYDISTSSWTVQSWAGELGTSDICEVFYFDGASNDNKKVINLTSEIGVYGDSEATYTVGSDGVITINADLKPLTTRVRFAGTVGVKVNVIGYRKLTSYNAINNTFSEFSSVSATVGADGYTPYIYGFLEDTDTRELSVYNSVDGYNTWFVRSFPTTAFRIGESGIVTIPTEETNRGWTVTGPPSLNVSTKSLSFSGEASSQSFSIEANRNYTYTCSESWLTITQSSDKRTLTVSADAYSGTDYRTATITISLGLIVHTIQVTQTQNLDERTFSVTSKGKTVSFKMKKVEAGTFLMGRAGTTDVETPVHSVTLTKDYYMGETEVTQALWYAIMEKTPTSDTNNTWNNSSGLGDDWPAYNISYNDCESFIYSLNKELSTQLAPGESFRFPTEAEWEFAAKGGTKSKGYTYAGSNTIDDVAWYYNNSSSSTHQIKTKAANELGLYDMSGNVWEWCEDWYGSYSTGAQTDPTGAASGSGRVLRGGSWGNGAMGCRVSIRYDDTPGYRDVSLGLRLALGAPISEPVPSLSVSPTSLSFGASASSKTVNVTANGDYTFSTSASWLTITQSSDKTTLTVSASANTGTSERTATITLTLGSLTQTISVTQEAAANTYDDERIFTVTGNGKTVTFKMIKVEGGTFQMGSTTGDRDAQPVHSVTLTKTYYMCETEVTQELWYAVTGLSPTSSSSDFWKSTYGIGDSYPAYYISYADCQSFLTTLNSMVASQLSSGEKFRFPTEAEWEFAAKGGTKSKGYSYAGSNTIANVAWYSDNSISTTHQVKTKAANELGIYDMSGNVWELCYDWYGDYTSSAQTDPTGPSTGSNRVLRGGGWGYSAGDCRVSNRGPSTPTFRYEYYGFRLCLGAPVEQ